MGERYTSRQSIALLLVREPIDELDIGGNVGHRQVSLKKFEFLDQAPSYDFIIEVQSKRQRFTPVDLLADVMVEQALPLLRGRGYGADTAAAYRDWGLSVSEVDELRDAGIIA